MQLLLDTHTFLWFVADDPALSPTAKSLIEDAKNQRLLSIASPWEVAVKIGIGKLTLTKPLEEFFSEQLVLTQTRLLPITLNQLAMVATLPRHHGDPFDRLIIAQAIINNVPVVSADSVFDAYPISRRW